MPVQPKRLQFSIEFIALQRVEQIAQLENGVALFRDVCGFLIELR
jgi:hypothetical protein